MKTTQKTLLLLALPLLALTACSKDEMEEIIPPGGQAGTGGDIRFEIGFAPQTRASTAADFTSAWEYGDEIGIFAVAHGQALSATASENHINNVKLTYTSAGGGTWTASEDLWWPGSGGKLDFYAYHPYNALATDPTAIAFNVKADQSAAADYSASDLLTAKADNNNNGYGKGSTVSLQFSHALSLIQVEIPVQGKGFGPGKDLTVTLRGVKSKAALDLGAATATPGSGVTLADIDNDPQNITMYRVEQSGDADYETSYTYRALVPAQEIADGKSLFWFEHEQRQILTDGALAQAFQMTAGQAEKFVRTLPATLLHTVPIPAGTFLMGSSNGTNPNNTAGTGLNTTPQEPNRNDTRETQHKVTLTKDFRMSKYQVTNTQYAAFLNALSVTGTPSGSYFIGNYNGNKLIESSRGSYDWGLHWDTDKWVPVSGYESHPVIYVTWYGAAAYCEWLTETTDTECRLPTEAQWEYACRGGKENQPFGIGDGYKLNNTLANFYWGVSWSWDGSSASASTPNTGTYPGTTQAVGSYPANAFGLYDMHGNVFEWCSDWYGDDYGSTSGELLAGVTDPPGPPPGISRVLRGGYWGYGAQCCRSAFRNDNYPDYAINYVGFRVAFVP